ncbi:unnamed protein product [Knipowitschia caucasica]|uniref:G2/mitotic-specific cyclin-B2 n=1 Tax=Knipowitschia caucasica TaxID=637954 RepID=A0AAV2LV03_KNICA
MSSLDIRAHPGATQNQSRMGKATVGSRRAALGELTNFNPAAVNTKRGASKTQACLKIRLPEKQAEVLVPMSLGVPAPECLLQQDVSMQEETALCQAFSEALLTVEDVDEEDCDLPQLCSHYVKDIYRYLHELERQQPVRPHYMQGYEITGRMRALLVDWLVQVHSRFQLLQETLYLTVAVLDRFLQVQPVSRRKLQLVGVTAMLVACKFEEMFAPEVGDFAYITDNAFSKVQILEMERVVLRSIKFQLGRPLPLHFLRRASKVGSSDVQRHTLAKYMMELTLLDYDMVHFHPSEIAAAALCLSQLLLHGLPWSPTQQHYSTYDEAHLKPIMQHMAKNVVLLHDGKTKFTAVKNKYSSSKLMKISMVPELSSPLIRSLAAAVGEVP